MVITVTLNPAMDKTVSIENFSIGKVNRILSQRYDVGGKGINVSKVLKNFGIDSTCTGFLGGVWDKKILSELKVRGIDCSFISVDGDVRTNMKIVDSSNKTYTDINETGPDISSDDMKAFIDTFTGLCKEGDIVILSGGVSPSVPRNVYGVLTEAAKKNGATVILDADGELLQEGIKAGPDILKPNEHEIMKLFNIENAGQDELISCGIKLMERGAQKVLISMGEKGALYITERGIYHSEGIKVPVKSTVGAGDSMVAALAYGMLKNYDDVLTLKTAIACGSVSVSLEGTEACTKEQTDKLMDRINVNVRRNDKWQ
jgi:1-phosphofructokinase